MRRILPFIAVCLLGCSSSSSSSSDAGADTGGGTDGSSSHDAGGDSATASDTGTDGSGDAGPSLNGCTAALFAANDHTAAGDARTVTFPTDPAPAQFSPPCMTIKAGQSVTWNGSFDFHPFGPFGGDTPSPITETKTGTTVTAAFPNAGQFGFHCEFHPDAMFGAVLVVP